MTPTVRRHAGARRRWLFFLVASLGVVATALPLGRRRADAALDAGQSAARGAVAEGSTLVATGEATASTSRSASPSVDTSGRSLAPVPPAPVERFIDSRFGNPVEGRPNVWAYLPRAFDPSRRAIDVVILFHGFHNCLSSFVSPHGAVCTEGHGPRTGYDLAAQIERSGIEALVIVPQLAFDTRSAAPGRLEAPGAYARLVEDVLESALVTDFAARGGARTMADVRGYTLVSLSGGNAGLRPALDRGGLSPIVALGQLDAHYPNDSEFDGWLYEQLPDFATGRRRFALIYTTPSPTFASARQLVDDLRYELVKQKLPVATLRHRAVEHLVTPDDFDAPLAITHSIRGHDEVAREDTWKVLRALGLRGGRAERPREDAGGARMAERE
jgi:hypothetical protein